MCASQLKIAKDCSFYSDYLQYKSIVAQKSQELVSHRSLEM